jgi:CheY-like chemotaxis protein
MSFDVLIIDDSNMDRILSEEIIKNDMFSSHITSCSSVREGLSYLLSVTSHSEKLPDVILLDINMPMLDGFDFLDSFLRFPEEVRRQCTIFMISATNSPAELRRITTYPIVRKFFTKPLTSETLNIIRTELEKQRI